MVERRPWLTVFTHIVLILGVLVIAFPLYLTFGGLDAYDAGHHAVADAALARIAFL